MLNQVLEVLIGLLVYAFAVYAVIEGLRGAPLTSRLADRKPLSCNLCMTFWCAVALALYLVLAAKKDAAEVLLTVVPAWGASLIVLRRYGKRTYPKLEE